jgi:hypothetical protein
VYIYDEEEDFLENYYTTVEMWDEVPSGTWIRNVDEFTFNLSSVSLRLGITIKF